MQIPLPGAVRLRSCPNMTLVVERNISLIQKWVLWCMDKVPVDKRPVKIARDDRMLAIFWGGQGGR